MSERKKVLVVGDVNVDLIVNFPKMLPDSTVQYPEPEMSGGGTCGNTLAALCNLGVETAFMGTVGDDAYGRSLMNDMKAAGVDVSALITDPELNTVCVFAFVDEKGERYLWGWPREKQSFQYLDWDKISWEAVREAGWIHSSGMMLVNDTSARKNVIEIFRRAKLLGIPTSFDLNLRIQDGQIDEGFRKAVLEILEHCSYVLGSGREEFYHLYPCPDWRDSARVFMRRDCTVIARMGAGGAIAITPEGEYMERAFDVKVSDTVGAGDVFNAGFIAARRAGYDIQHSLLWGNGVSGYKVGRKGGWATPSMEELQGFIASTPARSL